MLIKQYTFGKTLEIEYSKESLHLKKPRECCSGITRCCMYSKDSKEKETYSVLCILDRLQKSTEESDKKILECIMDAYIKEDIKFVILSPDLKVTNLT